MAVTIKKIAELAGVSIGTVDRVVNRRGKVKPEVEARIRLIIQEVGYTPNLTAKSLVLKRRAPKIGVIFHLRASDFNDVMMRGIAEAQKELLDYGVNILLRFSRDFSVSDQLRLIDELLKEGAKAIALVPIDDQRVADRIDALVDSGFAVYCLTNDIVTKLPHPFIGIDSHRSGKMAAGLFNLLSCERRQRVAVISPVLRMLGHTQRIEGLTDTISARYPHIGFAGVCEIPNTNIDIYKAVRRFLKSNPDVTQLWYATSIGDGGIVAMKELGLLGKVRIVGLDLPDFVVNGMNEGHLAASISQQPYRQGYHAIRTIFKLLLEDAYQPTFREEVACEILIRENGVAAWGQ